MYVLSRVYVHVIDIVRKRFHLRSDQMAGAQLQRFTHSRAGATACAGATAGAGTGTCVVLQADMWQVKFTL